MMRSIEDLKEIARRCRVGQPLGEDLSKWLAGSLEEFLTHRAHTVDDALGLRTSRGGVPWWRREALRRRNECLRQLASSYFARLGVTEQAHRIYQLARRYASSAWRFDRALEEMPPAYIGTPTELLWRAFKSGAAMPVGERQLRSILK